MLGFTRQSKNKGPNLNQYKLDFMPIIITNNIQKQSSLKKQEKIIKKKDFNDLSYKNPKAGDKNFKSNKNQWNTDGIISVKTFATNEIAAQQRRLRAEQRKQKHRMREDIIVNQKEIGTKQLKVMQQKDKEIQYLQKMIQKEKSEKAKIDKLYQQKKRIIEKQRQQLIQLEKRIQKQGIKQKKVVQQIAKISNAPQKDNQTQKRSKNKSGQNVKSQQDDNIESKNVEYKRRYEQPTQSQILHQKDALRQKKLDYLINKRQQCVKGLPNINYTPTLIPLLSKASYKIISTHVSQIVELLVDDLLQEQVYILQQIQLEQEKERQQNKQKQKINQYCAMVEYFAEENQQISNKIGKYSSMNFSDVYKPKYYPQKQKRSGFSYDNPNSSLIKKISLQNQIDDDKMQQIQNRKQRFIRFVSNFDEYKIQNINMFAKCTEEIIDQAIQKLAKQLDKGSGQFVDIVFRNQFN